MTRPPVDRTTQVGQFSAEHADHLVRVVAALVTAPRPTVEDASSYAWTQLLRRPDVALVPAAPAFGWLVRVAQREVWQPTAAERRVPDGLEAVAIDDLEHAPVHPAAVDVATLVEQREQLARVAGLPERRRRIVLLHGLGFSYQEITRLTGEQPRAIDRQLQKARHALRDQPGPNWRR